MKRALTFILILFFNWAIGQGRFDHVVVHTTQIKENLYMLEGAGGNIAVLTGPEGVLMIDAQFADMSEKIFDAIKQISPEPIKYLVNTHWHGDHTGGNEEMHKAGAKIIAHENVKNYLSKDHNFQAFNRQIKARPEGYWPEITVAEDMNLTFNGQEVFITHVHDAHTNGDVFVYFPKLNVLHMGDVFFKDAFPYIDLSTGGTVQGYIDAVRSALMMVDEETAIIPGHGSLANKNDLEAFLETLRTMKSRVENAMQAGKSLDQIQAMGLDLDYESWGAGYINGKKIIDTIWTDLSREE